MCSHKKLTKRDKRERKWLAPGSPSFLALEKIVKSQYLLGDLKHLTNFNHIGTLKVYHSVYNKYCPKRLHFSYPAMIARAELAALDLILGWDYTTLKPKKVNYATNNSF